MNLTIRQFVGLLKQINIIMRLESGSGTEPRMLSQEAQNKIAIQMFGSKRRKK